MNCGKCDTPAPSGANYCEECGSRIQQPAAVGGTTPVKTAGTRVPRGDDRFESTSFPGFAAATDRGLRHEINEDAAYIGSTILPQGGEGRALVVCDGVSTSETPHLASRAGVKAAGEFIRDGLARGMDPKACVLAGVAAADKAVRALPFSGGADLCEPSATIVAACVVAKTAYIAWAGDSRAYVLGTDAALLSADHSWFNEVVSCGSMTAEEAAKDRRAHAITRCLGPDADGPVQPGYVQIALNPGQALLLCTDGLWNYEEDPAALSKIAGFALGAKADSADAAARACRALIAFSNAKGGKDNIGTAISIV